MDQVMEGLALLQMCNSGIVHTRDLKASVWKLFITASVLPVNSGKRYNWAGDGNSAAT